MAKPKKPPTGAESAARSPRLAPILYDNEGELIDAIFEMGKRGARPELRGARVVLVPTWYVLPETGGRRLGGSAELHAALYYSIVDGHCVELSAKTTRADVANAVLVEAEAMDEIDDNDFRGLKVPEG